MLRAACAGWARFTWRGPTPSSRAWPRYTMDAALDPLLQGVARRCGADPHTGRQRNDHAAPAALPLSHRDPARRRRDPAAGRSVPGGRLPGHVPMHRCGCPTAEAEQLLEAQPDANVAPQQATQFISRILAGMPQMEDALNDLARSRARKSWLPISACDRPRATRGSPRGGAAVAAGCARSLRAASQRVTRQPNKLPGGTEHDGTGAGNCTLVRR